MTVHWGAWHGGWGGGMMMGLWWIFPLLGLIVFAVFLYFFIRFVTGGSGVPGFKGREDAGSIDALRKEISELREEIRKLKRPE